MLTYADVSRVQVGRPAIIALLSDELRFAFSRLRFAFRRLRFAWKYLGSVYERKMESNNRATRDVCKF
jgi:hypothetical protein